MKIQDVAVREPAAAEKFVAQEVFGFNGQPSEHGRIGILGLNCAVRSLQQFDIVADLVSGALRQAEVGYPERFV